MAIASKSPIAIAGDSQENPLVFTPKGSIPSRVATALAARLTKRPGNRATLLTFLVASEYTVRKKSLEEGDSRFPNACLMWFRGALKI